MPRQDFDRHEGPARFAQPAVFLVRPDASVYFAAVRTMPFARPHFSEILSALDFILENDHRARGEA